MRSLHTTLKQLQSQNSAIYSPKCAFVFPSHFFPRKCPFSSSTSFIKVVCCPVSFSGSLPPLDITEAPNSNHTFESHFPVKFFYACDWLSLANLSFVSLINWHPKTEPKRVQEKFTLPDSFKPDFQAREIFLVAFGIMAFRKLRREWSARDENGGRNNG